MNCPEQITIKLKDLRNNKPASRYIIYLTVLANRKNNYTVGPLISDDNGTIVLTKKQIEDEIEDSISSFLMDYSSRLDDCKQEVEVKLYTQKSLRNKVEKLREFYPKNAQELEALLKNSGNDLEQDFITQVLMKEEIIVEFP
jgi:hypothetical protein